MADGFRDPALAAKLLAEMRAAVTRPWAIMEVCGGQTHAVLRHGLDQLLPPEIELVHGPGCPVCVTPVAVIDHALAIAATPGVIFCTFGDMLRVPGSRSDLQRVKAAGGDVRVLYSPLDTLAIARVNPARPVVFFGIGFETTAPAHALAVRQAHRERLSNFSVLTSLVRVPPALDALLGEANNRVRAVLAAGHVCGVMGTREYPAVAARHRVPVVVTGFEPLDLLHGILRAVRQLEAGTAEVENAYGRVVTREGNAAARAMIREVFEDADREWRGIGVIPGSGWAIRDKYRDHDAAVRFPAAPPPPVPSACRSGEVLRGRLKPTDCAAFGRACTPRTPLGATMVSGEGACAAYYHAGKLLPLGRPTPAGSNAAAV
jgi:hydrogenase expression/formation protein HypD